MPQKDFRKPGAFPGPRTGIRLFAKRIPSVPLIALFETAFYQFAPESMMRYAVPPAWHDAGVRRWGFHGASHKFIAERSAELLGRPDIAEKTGQLYSTARGAPPSLNCVGAPPPTRADGSRSPLRRSAPAAAVGGGAPTALNNDSPSSGGVSTNVSALRVISCHLGGSSSLYVIPSPPPTSTYRMGIPFRRSLSTRARTLAAASTNGETSVSWDPM